MAGWTDWSPVTFQGATDPVAGTIDQARTKFLVVDDHKCWVTGKITYTGTGTAGAAVGIKNLPVAPFIRDNHVQIGCCTLFDLSLNGPYRGVPVVGPDGFIYFSPTASIVSGNLGTTHFTAALTLNDVLRFACEYAT